MRWLTNVLLAVAGVAVVASAVYVISNNHAPAKTGRQGAGRPTASQTTHDPPSTQPTTKPKALVVAFLGDNWTAGTGASSHKHRFTTLVSHDLHLTERNLGADGTWYAKATSSDGDYASRVADVVAANPTSWWCPAAAMTPAICSPRS